MTIRYAGRSVKNHLESTLVIGTAHLNPVDISPLPSNPVARLDPPAFHSRKNRRLAPMAGLRRVINWHNS
ncbi:MAG: hypothetical protein GX133_00150 [Syntrophomonadaceae bacterium]|nr:hypothetical protein [Syntrophomonadaceae bacterium]